MDPNDIHRRLKRLYVAVDSLEDYTDIIKKIRISSISTENVNAVIVNFGNLSKTEIENVVMSVIYLVGSLKDNVKRSLAESNRSSTVVEDMINSCFELSILTDLYNQDKHGYPLTKTKRSGKNPKISELFQALALENEPGKGKSYVSISEGNMLGLHGSFSIRVSGVVVAENGEVLTDVGNMIKAAVSAYEKLMKQEAILWTSSYYE